MTSTVFFTPVMCAGPETEPHSNKEEAMDVIVMLAKGAVAVVGTERSTTQPESFDREQGVLVLGAEWGRMICVFDWFDMDVEVVEVESAGEFVSSLESAGVVCGFDFALLAFNVVSALGSISSSPSGIASFSSCATSLAGVLI